MRVVLIHYVQYGFREGRCPSDLFSGHKELLNSVRNSANFAQFINILGNSCTFAPKPYVIRQGYLESLYEMPFYVYWELTKMCNYKCSYCFGQKQLDKSKFVPFHEVSSGSQQYFTA